MRYVFLFASLLLSYSLHAQVQVNGIVVKMTGTSQMTIQGMNFINDGIFDQTEGTVLFNGNTDNTIGGSNPIRFNNLHLAKGSGNQLQLLRTIRVDNQLNFGGGLLNLNGSNIILTSTALLVGENETSRVTGANGGYIEITNTLNNPSSTNPGNLGAVISSTANLGSTVIRRGHVVQVNGASNSIRRYYDIIPTNNSALNATLRFQYFDAELNGLAENSLNQWKSTNNVNWTNLGNSARDGSANFVTQTGHIDFARTSLFGFTTPLPVSFILFNVACQNNAVLLTWKTAQEENSQVFEVQRSTDGISFTPIATVPAAGNSTTERTYTYLDQNTVSATSYYRIVERDIDGAMQYTSTNRINCGEPAGATRVWPNPTRGDLFLSIQSAVPENISIKVFNAAGALVLMKNTALLPGNNQLTVNAGHLASGIYHLVIVKGAGLQSETIKVFKQ